MYTKENTKAIPIANIIIERARNISSPDWRPDCKDIAVLPSKTSSRYCLYPNYAILVIKRRDLEILSAGKRASRVSYITTLDWYDDVVMFFQHINHVGHIAFINMSYDDMLKYDFGPAANQYYREVAKVFGDLTDSENYSMYSVSCKIDNEYKYLSMRDAEPMIESNNRIIAVINIDGTIAVFKN